MPEKILFVDDDANILSGFQRTLRSRFRVETTDSAAKAFEMLKCDTDFAVVVSDYRMPNMNGVEFLSQAAVRWPNCVRVLLTGEADTRAAGAAVNQGQIFRFLLKPCPSLILEKTLTAALKHHQLLNAEKALLEDTLRGSMEVLIELLNFANPRALRNSQSLYKIMKQLLVDLPVDNKWEFELAALLSEIGNITVPSELLDKVIAGLPLSPPEKSLYASRGSFAKQLLERVARLELVAQIIGGQDQPVPPIPAWQAIEEVDRFHLGANLLHLAVSWNDQGSKGLPLSAFVVEARSLGFHPALIKAAEHLSPLSLRTDSRRINTSALERGMTLASDLIGPNGTLLLTKGQVLSNILVECLHKRAEYYGLDEEVVVHMPATPCKV